MRTVQIIPAAQQPRPRLRVCGYGRVSSDSDEQLESFVTQVEYYTSLIQKNPDWIYAGVYSDEGISGTSIYRRDDFNRMIRDCRNGKIDLILTKSISRFARNTLECIKTIRELKRQGIGIYFEKERINTLSEESELALTIYSSVAQEESISISQNMKWAIQKRMQDGSWLIPHVAYGYERNAQGELVPKQEESQIVKRIYDDYISGWGSSAITRRLNQEGIPSPGGKAWVDSTVVRILSNEIYVGDLLCQKFYNEDALPHKERRNRGAYPKYLIPDDHEAIISRDKAQMVKEIMELRKKLSGIVAHPGIRQDRYPFSRKIICEECGGSFKRQKIKVSADNQYIQWGCSVHLQNKEKCRTTGVRETLLEEAFIRLIRKLHDNVKILLIPLLRDIRKLQVSNDIALKVELYNKEILQIEKQIQVFRRYVSEGIMDTAVFMQRHRQLRGEIDYLKELRNQELASGTYDGIIAQLEYLIDCVNEKRPIKREFDKELFIKIVQQIVITTDRKAKFMLISGICFTEPL